MRHGQAVSHIRGKVNMHIPMECYKWMRFEKLVHAANYAVAADILWEKRREQKIGACILDKKRREKLWEDNQTPVGVHT